ncbi:MAG: Gfo/Idh/MocA family oxidoreductase [Bryobacterales bacterium]|nr:Gfo/Idh/MocA family oxidoreductase [Bryobacterales bacterium]
MAIVLRHQLLSGGLRPFFVVACIALVFSESVAAATKVGFIGLRHGHAWRQLSEISDIDEADFVGVAESIPGLVEEAKKIQPNARYAADYRAFVKETRPDIVWAFVANNRHLEIVEFLAPLGIHVIFEKPLAGSYADALRIRELATKHGIEVMTNYQMAWWAANHQLRRMVSEGSIGKVWRLHGVVGNSGPAPRDLRRKVFFDWLTDPDANGGGALIDFGIYNATWAIWHLGLPQQVYATVTQLQPERFPKVEDNAVFVLTYPEAVGIFEGSWDLPRGFQHLEVFGHEGSLSLARDSLTLQAGRKPATAVNSAALAPVASHPVRYMIDRVTSRQPLEHIVALDLNVDAVQILEAAKVSASEQRPVQLPLPTPTRD